MDRVLLVACRTAAGAPLLEAVRRRAALSPCKFTLLVPRPCHGLHRVVDPEDHGWREAKDVIETACPVLGRAAGSEVAGMIGSHDPVAAVEDALNMHGFDEVIVSTLAGARLAVARTRPAEQGRGHGRARDEGQCRLSPATSPPRRAAAPGVLVLHAWWGLSDGIRRFCDGLAEQGFVALAPDLCAGRTARTVEEAQALAAELDDEAATRRAAEGLDRLRAHPAVHGPVGVVGFSMGVWFALDLAAKHADVGAVVLYYGTGERHRPRGSSARRCSATSPSTTSGRRPRR